MISLPAVAVLVIANAAATRVGRDDRRTRVVVVEAPRFEGEIGKPDRDALMLALRRGLESHAYSLFPKSPGCRSRSCDEALVRQRASGHRIELHLRGASRSYELELRAFSPGATTEPFATAAGRCDICGITELEQLVVSKAHALRQRLATRELAPAIVSVSSTPSGSTVWIDGKRVGTTPFVGEVKPGAHELRVARAGYFSAHTGMTASRGVAERKHTALEPMPRHRAREVIGATGLAVGLAALAGGVTMLALDGTEIGRRCGDGARDVDGDCPYVHRTMAGGIALTATGAVLAATGVALLVVEGRRPRNVALRTQLSPQRIGLTLSF